MDDDSSSDDAESTDDDSSSGDAESSSMDDDSSSDDSNPPKAAADDSAGSDGQQLELEPPDPSQGMLSPMRRLLEAICQSIINCPIPNDDLLFPRAFFHAQEGDDLANCIRYYSGYGSDGSQTDTEALLERLLEAESDGGLRIDWNRLDELSDCSLPFVSLEPVFVGLRQAGEQCHLHDECADGYCDTSSTCPGSCATGLADGEACLDAQQCLSRSCDGELCVTAANAEVGATLGEPCSYFSDERRYCADGLWCNDDGVCQAPIGAGEPCLDDDEVCVDGHVCVPLAEEPGQERQAVCAEVELIAEGQPCTEDYVAIDGRLRTCDPIALEICADGICTHLPEGMDGDECTSNDQTSSCATGYYCDWGGEGCQPKLATGDACSSSQECNCHERQCVENYCSYSDW